MNKQQIKPFAIGAVAGAIALAIVMFSTGWAVTSNTAQTNARKMSQDAVVESLAAICVAQFEQADDKDQKLSKLVATDSWQRGGYVSDQGWATMPGSDTPASDVATACAQRLAKIQN